MSASYEFILLNGLPFPIEIESRKYSSTKIGSGTNNRLLNGTATEDITARKSKWTFDFILTSKNLLRLLSIYNSNTTITLVDTDSVSYSVLWSSNWEPSYEGKQDENDIFTISVDFDEV